LLRENEKKMTEMQMEIPVGMFGEVEGGGGAGGRHGRHGKHGKQEEFAMEEEDDEGKWE
jgi:hypothetical protein